MRQRQKRVPVAHAGVDQFLKKWNGNRRSCAKALKYMSALINCGGDMELHAVLMDEFREDIEALRRKESSE